MKSLEDLVENKEILRILKDDINGFIKNEQVLNKFYPSLYPYSSSKKNESPTSTFKAGDEGENLVYQGLKRFINNKENMNKEWYLFHSIGKSINTWLTKKDFKGLFNKLHGEAKDRVNIENARDPDFILIHKNYGIFMIDSKNVNEKQAKESFNKALNQSKVFKSFLEILFEGTPNFSDFNKLNFFMGACIPEIEDNLNLDKNNFIITKTELLNDKCLEAKLSANEKIETSIYDDIIRFFASIKTKFDKGMSLDPINTIDSGLMTKTINKIEEMDSLIGKKYIINGPAGSGKTYRIMNNIIDVLTPYTELGLVYSDDLKIYNKTKDEIKKLNKKIRIFKYLNDVYELANLISNELNNSSVNSKVFIFHKNYESLNFLLIAYGGENNFIIINTFDSKYLAKLSELCSEFIVESGFQMVLTDIKKNQIKILQRSFLKETIEKEIGNSILFINSKFKEMNMFGFDLFSRNCTLEIEEEKAKNENKKGTNKHSRIHVFEIEDHDNILNEYEPNIIILCFASLYAIDKIKDKIKKEKEKARLYDSIKYYHPCDFNELDLNSLKFEIDFYCLNNHFVLFVGKYDDNQYYYDILDFKENDDFILTFKKLNGVKKIKTFYSFNKELTNKLRSVCEILGIKLIIIDEEDNALTNIFKNSFFLVKPCDFALTLYTFETLMAFEKIRDIHIFADDMMSSIQTHSKHKYPPLCENTRNKIKTFLVTFDSNQCTEYNLSSIEATVENVDFPFDIESLDTVYRCNKKVFDYLMPFYEYSNYLRYDDTPVEKEFDSFLEFKTFINKEVERIRRENEDVLNRTYRNIRLAEPLVDIVKSMPYQKIKCGNTADSFDVIEVSVSKERLLESIEKAIAKAINAKGSVNEIGVILGYNHSLDKENQRGIDEYNREGNFTDLVDSIELVSRNGSLRRHEWHASFSKDMFSKDSYFNAILNSNIFLFSQKLSPYLEFINLLENLKQKYSKKCTIINIIFENFATDQGKSIKYLYSSEFKHLIYVIPGPCRISHNDSFEKNIYRFEPYFIISRATMNLTIIYVKEQKPIDDDVLD